MSGATIIGDLLRADAALIAVVAAGNIKMGRLKDGTALPALLVRTVSVIDRQPLVRGAIVHSVERVSVTVRAVSYRQQQAVINLVRKACAGKIGGLSDCARVAVLTAGTGPDLAGPGDSYEQAQDFRVSFDAAA